MTINEDEKHNDILGAALAVGTAIVGVGQAFTWLQLENRHIRIDAHIAATNAKLDNIKADMKKLIKMSK